MKSMVSVWKGLAGQKIGCNEPYGLCRGVCLCWHWGQYLMNSYNLADKPCRYRPWVILSCVLVYPGCPISSCANWKTSDSIVGGTLEVFRCAHCRVLISPL